MSVPKELETLVAKLEQASAEGRVAWHDTTDENKYAVDLSRATVTLGRGAGVFSLDRDAVTVEVIDSEGNVVDDFTVRPGDDDYDRMSRLFQMARRRATNIEGIVDSIVKELETRAG